MLTGEDTVVKVRRKLVDATYVESSIPSRHRRPFTADPDVRVIPPNDLVDLGEPTTGFTVLGAGKTAMDTCNWLLDAGVDPDAIQWFRPRDPWLFNRVFMQPLELVGAYMHLQACWVEAAAEAVDATEFAQRLEAHDIFVRLDPATEPRTFRGATISVGELESLRTIERIVRQRRVMHIGSRAIVTDQGDVATDPGQVYIDCTAAGVRATIPCPIFEPDRLTLQYVTIGIVPWSAATVAVVEAMTDDDAEKNRLCPPLAFSGEASDILRIAHTGMTGLMVRSVDADLSSWTEASRLNPAGGAADHIDDPRVPAALASIGANFAPAMANLERLTGAAPATATV